MRLKRHTVRGTDDCAPPKAEVVTMEAAAAAAAPVSASIVEKAAKESHLAVYPLFQAVNVSRVL